jgi:hypothetical protein
VRMPCTQAKKCIVPVGACFPCVRLDPRRRRARRHAPLVCGAPAAARRGTAPRRERSARAWRRHKPP